MKYGQVGLKIATQFLLDTDCNVPSNSYNQKHKIHKIK